MPSLTTVQKKRFFSARARFAIVIAAALLVGSAIFSVSSAHKARRVVSPQSSAGDIQKQVTNATVNSRLRSGLEPSSGQPGFLTTFLPPADPDPDLVQTFAPDCTTPKTAFVLGDTVCARISGGPSLALYPRKFSWVSNGNVIFRTTTITSDPQTDIFMLPGVDPDVDYRGVWRINSINAARSSVRASAFFTVSNPAAAAVNLAVYKSNDTDGSITAGSNIFYSLWLTNYGPDTATNVTITDDTPANTTFVSGDPGAGITCTFPTSGGTGPTTCTLASLAQGASNKINIVINVNPGASAGTIISNSAIIANDLEETFARDNTGTSVVTVVAGAPGATCTLQCPDNVTAFANTTESSQRGAHVTYDPPISSGDCGSVSATPASGTFFPVGDTVVNVTSETGDGACSFTVTVVDTGANPPTISCPANITANADSNCSAVVTLGTPATTGDNVTVTGTRSDGKSMYNCDVNGENCVRKTTDDPFSAGITTVTWTAYSHDTAGPYLNNADEEAHRIGSASCTQTVAVYDVTPPTITSGDLTSSADANCLAAVPDFSTIASVTDNCACASSDTSQICDTRQDIAITQDVAPGTLLGLGPHTIQLTANDGSITPGPDGIIGTADDIQGNVSVKTITFTVVDTTPPAFTFVPPTVIAYTGAGATTCDTVVDPGMATATDNCSAVTITRSPSGNTFPVGNTTITWTAKDAANNTSTATQLVTVIDNTPPVISCPANLTVNLPLNTTATSMAVSYPPATATDNCAGPINIVYSIASGSTFSVGTTPVTATATDAHGNSASCTFTITVLYDFTGFFSPVGNPPILNAVNAGRAIPVKFSLSGNKGLSIFAANNPYSISLSCASGDPGVDVTETLTAGGSSLSYDAGSDQYIYVWKTDSSWAGTCRQLVVTLNDGSVHVANFKFK